VLPDNSAILTYEFVQLIVEIFNFEETRNYMCLHYRTYHNGIKRIITLGEAEPVLHNKNIEDAKDLVLSMRLPAGTTVIENISCDSSFLASHNLQDGDKLETWSSPV
jgi:hypothetical protein